VELIHLRNVNFKDIAELAGIAAIVLGLVLVTYELQQNNEQLAEQSRQSVADGVRQITLSVATSPDLARLISGEVPIAEMTRTERMQFTAWFAAWLKTAEHAFIQYQSDILSEEIWLTRKTQALGMFNDENFLRMYERNKNIFIPGFIAAMDEALSDLPEQ